MLIRALTRWDSLTLYVADARIGIDNNPGVTGDVGEVVLRRVLSALS